MFKFPEGLLENPTTDPSGVCMFMDFSGMVLVDESSNFFSIFSVIFLVLGCPEHSWSSFDAQPALKHECHSYASVHLKEYSAEVFQSFLSVSVADLQNRRQDLSRHIAGFGHPSQTKHLSWETFM
jgi:hypothetical protein